MKLRALMLGSALLFAALPAFADVYATNPTPGERAQTEQLNAGAAARAHSDADQDAAARADFNARQDAVDRDRARYQADRARYERDRARYDRDYGDARRWDVFFGHGRFQDVEALSPRQLIGLRVSTRGGGRVGLIRDVDTNRYGRISRVAIGIGGGNAAWVDTDDLRYDPATNVVYTTLSRDQVGAMARLRYPRF